MNNLRCANVSKKFGGIIGLSQVCLEVHCGEVAAIIGPNGAGKTTLFNILTGFLTPDSGSCFLGGRELTGLKPHQIAQLGVVRTFQNLRLLRSVPVLENLMLSLPGQTGERILGISKWFKVASEEKMNIEKSVDILRLLNLEHKARELTGSLSYGEQKLLTLGCALATGATFLLLDEPLAGVHPDLGERILDVLKRFVLSQRGVLFIEHDIDAVRAAADQVIVMGSGRVIAEGPPHDVLERADIVEAYLA